MRPQRLPAGTVTFLFTDIEGSTQLLQRLGDSYDAVLLEHRRLLRAAFQQRDGVEVDTQGDAFFYAFARASDAVAAAREGQHALKDAGVRVRMGIHTGEARVTDEGYVGIDVHRAARICATAHGGQVVLSDATARLVNVDVHDLGEHRLKDLSAPQHLYQLGHDDFPPLRSLRFTNLPVQATALVGRDRECREAGSLLRDHRLVTLVGPAGTGKTRLALQVAADATADFEDGVFWVPLASVRDAALVEPAIAAVVGIKEHLANSLASKRALFLLDNFEQVVDAAPRLAEVLGTAPAVKLLVTSRERLSLSGEWEYSVPSMVHEEAVVLFTERAKASRNDFEQDDAVAQICTRLDGLPLAIELAAARVKVLTSAQILERLGRRLDLLTGGARDVPDRQRTLRSTIDWSYELLTGAERELFARLGLFSAGWTLHAMEAVCEGDIETLQSLVGKSLVKQAGERFALLETIREYALERLGDLPQQPEMVDRHAGFFLELAEEAALGIESGDQETWISKLKDEHGNLHAALDHFVRSGATDLELRLVAAVWEPWFLRGLWQESRLGLDHALRMTSADSVARATALRGAAWLTWRQGDLQGSRLLAEQAVQMSRKLGHARLLGRSLRVLAVTVWGDAPQSTALLEESADAAQASGDLAGLARVTSNLALRQHEAGNHRGAVDGHTRAMSLARQAGDQIWGAVYVLNLSEAEIRLGEYERARDHLTECLRLARHFGVRELIVDAVYCVIDLAVSLKDYGWSAALIGVAQREADFGYTSEMTDDRLRYEELVRSTREGLGGDRFESTVGAGRAMTLDAVMDYLEKGEQLLTALVDVPQALSLVIDLETVPLSSFAIVGHYMRFNETVRNALKDARQRIVAGLERPGHKRNSHLIWAAPGTGKTYFVQQVAESIGNVTYREINLAECDADEFRAALKELERPGDDPRLCLVDECEAKPGEPWPYELLLPTTWMRLSTAGSASFSSSLAVPGQARRR